MAVNIYDMIFLVIFFLATAIFLYIKRDNLSKEGIMYLYRTKLGLKVIDSFGKKHAKFLKMMEYPLYIVCYILMITGVFYFTYTLIQYLTNPLVAEALKAPIIFPVIPYFTEFFGLDSYLPTFYFVSFLVSVGITMVIHEFSHGIYARMYGVKIKSTGFAFVGPVLATLLVALKTKAKRTIVSSSIIIALIIFAALLFKSFVILLFLIVPFFGAFVEQDDKQMVKAKKRAQLSIIGAGVFSNILTMILFIGVLWIFFILAYQPAGVVFNDYARMPVNMSDIKYVNGISIDKLDLSSLDYNNASNYVSVTLSNNITYFTGAAILNYSIDQNLSFLGVYENSPAFKANLRGLIHTVNGKTIGSSQELIDAIRSSKPGQTMTLGTNFEGQQLEFNIQLADRNGSAYLGIAPHISSSLSGIKKIIVYITMITPKRENFMTGMIYTSSIGNDLGDFIFNLIWWIVLLNFAVAIANMLPAGIFDGGRFFLLTIWGITGSKKAGENAFKWSTYFILLLFGIFMLWWLIRPIFYS